MKIQSFPLVFISVVQHPRSGFDLNETTSSSCIKLLFLHTHPLICVKITRWGPCVDLDTADRDFFSLCIVLCTVACFSCCCYYYSDSVVAVDSLLLFFVVDCFFIIRGVWILGLCTPGGRLGFFFSPVFL